MQSYHNFIDYNHVLRLEVWKQVGVLALREGQEIIFEFIEFDTTITQQSRGFLDAK